MGPRASRLLAEVARFLTVGGLATLVAFVLFNALVHGVVQGPGPMHDDPLVAFVLANTVGMVLSYRGSRSWAFRDREAVGVAGGRVRYLVINVVSMVIPLGCLTVSRYLLGLSDPVADNISANVIGLGLGTLARFWALRRFIFLTPAGVERRRAAASATRLDRVGCS
jgi:putative flippase GtrA